jgi:hypothetical protein
VRKEDKRDKMSSLQKDKVEIKQHVLPHCMYDILLFLYKMLPLDITINKNKKCISALHTYTHTYMCIHTYIHIHIYSVKINAVARAILREDGKDPSCDLGPPVHSWGSWSRTKQLEPWQKTLVGPPSVLLGFLVRDQAV